jgi:putative FmdB family regulatory protein
MPIYDYRCDHCGHVFSAVQSFSDEALEKCPNCGKKPRRLLSMPAIVFKGSGWYKTDSRPADKSSDSSGTSTEKKADTKSDAKTETKSEPKTEKKSETKASETPAPKSDAAS